MKSADFQTRSLATRAIHAVDAGIVRRNNSIGFVYRIQGDIARVRIPEKYAPERTDLLWKHTCFEAFIARQGDPAYREFNFSPSGQWAVYDFSSYRCRLPDPALESPQIAIQITEGRLELEAWVSSPLPGLPWEIGLSAVIEAVDTNDGLSYWALCHPSLSLDFHRRESFSLLEAMENRRGQETVEFDFRLTESP